MPDIDNLIKALECDEYKESVCKNCPYGYSYLDDRGDNPIWTCDEERKLEEATAFLKIYKYLISVQ